MKSSFIFFSTQKHWVLTHSFMILIWSGKIKNKYLLICLEFCKILTWKDDCYDTKKLLQKTIFWNHISRLLYLSSNDALSWKWIWLYHIILLSIRNDKHRNKYQHASHLQRVEKTRQPHRESARWRGFTRR